MKLAIGQGPDGVGPWMTEILDTVLNPENGLFMVEDGSIGLSPMSLVLGDEGLRQLRFVGRLLGKALQQNVKLPKARLRPHLAKHLLNQPFSFPDLAEVAPEAAEHVEKIRRTDLTAGPTDSPGPYFFTASEELLGEARTVELRPNGSMITVNEENKAEYCALLVQYHLHGAVAAQMDALRGGFQDVFPTPLPLAGPELLWLLAGFPAEALRSLCTATCSTDPQVGLFWQVVDGLSRDQQAWMSLVLSPKAELSTDAPVKAPEVSGRQEKCVQVPHAESLAEMGEWVQQILDVERLASRFHP